MRWLVAALVLASCGAPARPARPGSLVARRRPVATAPIPSCDGLHAGAGGARACAIAELDVERGVLDVFLRVEADALPPGRADVEVVTPAETRALGPVTEPVELRYTVALESSVAAGASYRHAAGWHLHGRSFLPEIRVDGAAVDVPATLLLEVGDAPLYTSAGPNRRVFDAPGFARLADEVYEVGAVAITRREVEADTVWVAASGRTDGELEAAADALGAAYRQLHDALGEPSTDAVLASLHRADGARWSERAGASVGWAFGASEDPAVDLADALRPLVHVWLGGDDPWLAGGVADYLAVRAGVEVLDLDPAAVERAMLRRAERQDATARGALVAYCVDGHLRERSSSLAASLRRARAAGELGTEALLSDLAALDPGAAGYLAALMHEDEALAIDECLERAGWRAARETFAAPPPAALREALAVTAWAPLESLPALRVTEVAEGSPLTVGDVVLAVAGHPVAIAEDVAFALRAAEAGDAVELRVRRRGEVVTPSWTLPALEAEPAEREHTVLVAAEPAAP